MDVSIRSLETARDRLKLDRLPDEAGGPDQAAPRLADVPGPAAGGLRRRRRRRGGRAPRPAPAVGLRAGALRVRPAGDGRADDAQPGVQRDVGERSRPESSGIPTTASSGPEQEFRDWAERGRRAVRLCGAVPAGRAGGRGAGSADADGGVRAERRRSWVASRDEFVKYPRTPHLFGSRGTDDDKHLGEAESLRFVADESLIVEEKIDGTNVGIHFTPTGRWSSSAGGT